MRCLSFFKAVVVFFTIFQILGCTGKKADSSVTSGASQDPLGMGNLVANTQSLAAVEEYLAQYQLKLAAEAPSAVEQFSGVSIQGTVAQITMKDSGFVLAFDPVTLRVVPNSYNEEGLDLAEKANSALLELLSRVGKVTLVVGLNDLASVSPELLYGSDQNPTPFTTRFQVDASLLLEGSGATSLTVVGRKASSFSSDKQVLLTAKGSGQTTRCGGFSGCKPPAKGGGLGYPFTNNGKCPVYANGTFYMEGGACTTEASQCGPYPQGITLYCCSNGPGTLPTWSYNKCNCPDPARPVPFGKSSTFPDICCPIGSVLDSNGQCACPAGQALQNGKCAPCPGSQEAVNGVCQCKAPLVPGRGANTGNCMCPAEDEILVNGQCIHSPYPPAKSCADRVRDKELPPEFTKDCHYIDTNPTKGPVSWCCPGTLECGATRETSRTCGCTLPQIMSGNKCVCPGDKVFDPTAKTCSCPADKPLAVGDKCYACDGGKVFNAVSQKCECPADKPIFSGGACTACPASEPIYVPSLNRCVKDSCSGGAVLDPITYACSCPMPIPFWDGKMCTGCTFPGSHLEVTNGKKTCECDSDKPKLVAGVGCFPCGFGEENVNGACVCKAGFDSHTEAGTTSCYCAAPKMVTVDGKCELPPAPSPSPDPSPTNAPSPTPSPSPDPSPVPAPPVPSPSPDPSPDTNPPAPTPTDPLNGTY